MEASWRRVYSNNYAVQTSIIRLDGAKIAENASWLFLRPLRARLAGGKLRSMKHEFAEKWSARLLILEAQLEREPASARMWHWRGEARVTRFLLRRYGEIKAPGDAATAGVAASGATELSPIERALLRMALVIPGVHTKHPRPAPCERAAILERIKCARDEGRQIEATEESWLANVGVWLELQEEQARRNSLRLREREEDWKWRERERLRENLRKRRS